MTVLPRQTTIQASLQRDINGLSDPDRSTRRRSVSTGFGGWAFSSA